MKGKWKRGLAAILAAAVIGAGMPLSAQAAQFTDVPENAWYKNYVYDLVEKSVISGTSASTFSPDSSLTRAAFATMLSRAALSDEELEEYRFKGVFKDVPESHWANRFINWAYENGVVNGCGDGTFKPDDPVTRQDMAVMVVNFANATCRKMPLINEAVEFNDSDSISGYAKSSVSVCQQAGVISGYNGSFSPKGYAQRSAAVTLFSLFLKNCLQSEDYTIYRKRVNQVAIRAVEFDPKQYTPDLVTAWDKARGGETSTSMIERTGAKIAVNASFFDMSSYEALGTLVRNGQVVTVFDRYAPAKSALTYDKNGKFSIQNFSTVYSVVLTPAEGEPMELTDTAMNRKPSSDEDATRILFTRAWGDSLHFTASDAVTVNAEGIITDVSHNADVPIPETGYVLAQASRREYEGSFFDSCQVGDRLDISYSFEGAENQDILLSIGTGPRIVKDGAAYGDLASYQAEGYTDPSITTYEAVRMCAGIKADGTIVLLSAYTTLQNLSNIMLSMGCVDAVNFDGGGSTTLYVDGFWLRGPQDRLLNNMLVFK